MADSAVRDCADSDRVSVVHIEGIDPRDTRWERNEPAYRVYFWDGNRVWASTEWRLTETDVPEVLAWARDNAHGRRITVWIEATDQGEPGLLRLAGWEPVSARPAPDWVRVDL
jgi:hypothetical protein